MNIQKTVLFGGNGLSPKEFDEKVWKVYEANPDFVVPFAANIYYKNGDVEYIRQCLEKGFYGLGELLIGHPGAREKSFSNLNYDDEIPVKIFKVASEFNAPVLVHCDEMQCENFINAMEKCPETTFIWAHMGNHNCDDFKSSMRSAEQLSKLLDRFPNLFFDMSFYETSANCMNREDYFPLMEKYSTRFVFGFDMTKTYHIKQKQYFEGFKFLFSKLSNETLENIFYNNMNGIIEKRKSYILKNV